MNGKNSLKADRLTEQIMEVIKCSESKITMINLVKILVRENLEATKKEIHAAVTELITAGEIEYTYVYGNSYLEVSFNRPVKVSGKVILSPYRESVKSKNDMKTITLLRGVSFGLGTHPTTRLAIRGVEFAVDSLGVLGIKTEVHALDIGTGSGVLAICSVLLGIERAIGVDIDACARHEARENVKINGVSDRIDIIEKDVNEIKTSFNMVMANLRMPTLLDLAEKMKNLVNNDGWLVISGIQSQEKKIVLDVYRKNKFQCKWQEEELGWCGLVFLNTENKNV